MHSEEDSSADDTSESEGLDLESSEFQRPRELEIPRTSLSLQQSIRQSRHQTPRSEGRSAFTPTDYSFVQAVAEFSQITSDSSLGVDRKLSRLISLCTRYLDAAYGVLTKWEEGRSRIIACESLPEHTEVYFSLPPGAGFEAVDSLFSQLEPNELLYYDRIPFSFEPEFLSKGAAIAYPMSIGEENSGVLSFWSLEPRAEKYSQAEMLLVRMVSRWISSEVTHTKIRDALTRRMEFEQLLSRISRNFINHAPSEVDREMQNALELIAKFANVDLSYIFLFKDKNTRLDITHCWLVDDAQPEFRVKDIEVNKYGWAMEKILNRETVYIEELSDIPDSAPAVLRFCKAQGVRSAIMVPMVHSGMTIGLLGFAVRNRKKQFDEQSRTLLQMVGSTFASAVQFKRAQESVSSLEAQVRHAQKLESLGVLAGGIAHDFNNLLMGIMGNASIALEQIESSSPAKVSVGRVERIAQHAAELTNQLLAYSGQGKFFNETINLSATVEEMVDLLDAAKSKKHVLRCNFASDLPTIEGDVAQISQVIMNLITNASEAIGEDAGTITLNTGLVAVDKEYLMDTFLCEDTPEGVYTYLRVADTGCGMDPETVSKIFDPFFTTKFTGRGLGLAAVLGIVRSHKGTLKVHSKPGEGTIITVVFPCSQDQSVLEKTSEGECISFGSGVEQSLVLVVDDEETVRTVVSESLHHLGFKVLEAKNGIEAIEKYKADAGRIEFIVLDMSMPDMSGVEVFRQLEAIEGKAQVVLMSGYSESEFEGSFSGNKFGGFIQKPFRPQALASKIEKLRVSR